jgi:hypothetical protein
MLTGVDSQAWFSSMLSRDILATGEYLIAFPIQQKAKQKQKMSIFILAKQLLFIHFK